MSKIVACVNQIYFVLCCPGRRIRQVIQVKIVDVVTTVVRNHFGPLVDVKCVGVALVSRGLSDCSLWGKHAKTNESGALLPGITLPRTTYNSVN